MQKNNPQILDLMNTNYDKQILQQSIINFIIDHHITVATTDQSSIITNDCTPLPVCMYNLSEFKTVVSILCKFSTTANLCYCQVYSMPCGVYCVSTTANLCYCQVYSMPCGVYCMSTTANLCYCQV